MARGGAGDVCALGELEAEGGGNIKQELCVLSSQRLDRTPPKPNEFFLCVGVRACMCVCGSPTPSCIHRHSLLYTLGFRPSCVTFVY